ncbi:branched-chain amino acid aminotransferase [Myxococcaceae bacterium]|jgi:branched-chain amino acid aminotransferase|nr:branched-chain amino acid aminotransferase [Myxococcaceae bacterium]
MKVWIDGKVVEGAEAKIPVNDHGLLYGDGLFEGIRVYGGRVFRLDLHLSRLAAGARALGIALPGGVGALRAIVLETARAFGASEAYVRLLVTRGEGPLGVDPTTCPSPRILCIVDAIRLYPAEQLARGLDLVTVSLRRPPADVLDPRVKSLNYLNSVLAKLEAKRRGADEALILNLEGRVAEASVANVFVVRDGRLATPPPADGALEGITRRSVLELAARLGFPAEERSLGRADLFAADEAFLTGTGARIVAIRSLDQAELASKPPGPVTRSIDAAFSELVKEPAMGTAL